MFSEEQDMNSQETFETKKNTFVFESFNDKLKKINVRITNKVINTELFLDNNFVVKDEMSFKDDESNFLSAIKRERQINSTEDFLIIYDEIEPYIKSYVMIVNNGKIILEILKKYLEFSFYEKNKNNQLTISVLELLCGLIKDIRAESFDLFLNFILKELVTYLRKQINVELIDKIFSVFTNIFKFLNKQIITNFEEFFCIYAELIFNKNPNIRKFGCESICFILKNLDKYNITMMSTIFEPFSNPDKFFNLDNNVDRESTLSESSYSFYNYLKSKDQLKEALISNNDLFYIFDCISDLFAEVLIGVNKALSIKADMFISKMNQGLKNSSNKYLLHSIIIYTMIKLMKRITNPEKQQNVVKLFYYYLLLNINNEENKEIQYQSKNFNVYNELFQKQGLEEEIVFSIIHFNKELLINFHLKLDKSILSSVMDEVNIISNNLNHFNNDYLIINYLENLAILMKMYNKEFSEKLNLDNHSCINTLLPLISTSLILKFLSDLQIIKNYRNFKKYSLFYIEKEAVFEEEENEFNYSNFIDLFKILIRIFNRENKMEILLFFSYLGLLINDDFNNKFDDNNEIFIYIKEILNEKLKIFQEDLSTFEENKDYFKNIIEISDCFLLIYTYFASDEEVLVLFSSFVNSFLVLIEKYKNKNILKSNSIEANEIFNVVFSKIKEETKYYISKIDFYYGLFYKLLKKSYQFIEEDILIKLIDLSFQNINSPHCFKLITFLSERLEKVFNHITQKINKSKLLFNLLLNDKKSRLQTLCFIYKLLDIEKYDQSEVLIDIFETMKKICSLEEDFQNQKSFSFNFEILISKFELVAKPSSEIIEVIYLFLFGSFWIRLQKGVWPSINKAVESFCSIANHNVFNTHFSIMKSVNEIINTFISVEGYLQKFESKIKEKFFIIDFENTEQLVTSSYEEIYLKNISHKLFYKKFFKQYYVETFVEGYLQGIMQTSKVVHSSENLSQFILYTYDMLMHKPDVGDGVIEKNQNDLDDKRMYFLCLIKNIICENYNDQTKVSRKVNESLFYILMKISEENKQNFTQDLMEKVKTLIFKNLYSTTHSIQLYCINTLANLDLNVKNYRKLLEKISNNPYVIENLYNLDLIKSDSNVEMKKEEKDALIPVMTRLHYAKFSVIHSTQQTKKKIKIKNKSSLISYFIQLNETNFFDYIHLIFEPNFNLFESIPNIELSQEDIRIDNIYNLELRNLKKFIEILTINFKQMHTYFKRYLPFTLFFITKVLNFISNFKYFLDKHFHFNEFYDFVNEKIKPVMTVDDKYYHLIINEEEIKRMVSHSNTLIKDLKKNIFKLLNIIFSKNTSNRALILKASGIICENFSPVIRNLWEIKNPKFNSFLDFIFSWAKNENLHYILQYNNFVIDSVLNIVKNETVDYNFNMKLLDFIRYLIFPYFKEKITKNSGLAYISKEEEKNRLKETNEEDEMIIDDDNNQQLKDIENLQNSIVNDKFLLYNEVILFIFQKKEFSFSLKNPLAQSMLRNLLFLWNLFDSGISLQNLSLLPILTKFLNDKYIYKQENEQSVFELLNICLIIIRINKNNIESYYRSFIELITVIQNNKNKRVLVDILIEYSEIIFPECSSNFKEILQIIYLFNVTTNRNLDGDADSSNVIDSLNLIDSRLLTNQIYVLEPLIYELLLNIKNEDFTIQTITQQKLNMLFKSIILNNFNDLFRDEVMTEQKYNKTFVFESIIEKMFDLLTKNNNNLIKNILELFFTINTCLKEITEEKKGEYSNLLREKICYDLFECQYTSSKDEVFNFYEGIMHIQYHIRVKLLEQLKERINSKFISQFTIIKIILPIVKHFLNPFTYIESEKGFIVSKVEGHIFNLIDATLDILGETVKCLEMEEIDKLIDHFNRMILKFEKKEIDEEDEKYINLLYKGLSRILENTSDNTNFDFNKEFLSRMKTYILDNREKNFFDLIKEKQGGSEISLNNQEFNQFADNIKSQNSNILSSLLSDMDASYKEKFKETLPNKRGLFNLLKRIITDHKKKAKKKDYYLKNFAIASLLELLKHFEPSQTKYEVLNILLEIINNLKNRNFAVREKAREGLKMIIKSFGPYYINFINEELKNSLCHGYQRYVLGYTVNFLLNTAISIKGKTEENDVSDLFDFVLPNVMEILLDEIFGEVAEDREVEQIAKRYVEAKNNKSLKMFSLIASKINFKNSILTFVFDLKNKLINRENDSKSINKANEVIYHIILGLKTNGTITKDELLILTFTLISNGLEINMKNSDEINKHKNLIVKGEATELDSVRRDFKSQFNDTFSIQIGAAAGKNYMIEISKLYLNDKNEIILANLFTYLGLELVLIGIKSDVFNLKQYRKVNSNQDNNEEVVDPESFNKITEERFDLVLQKTVSCLKISNSKILSKSLKILTNLFDYRLIIIKTNLKRIISTIFRNLNIFGSEDINMTQSLISSINKILLTFNFSRFSNNQIKILIDVISIHINNYHLKPYVYSCLDALIKKKVIHPSIYDMLDSVKESYLQSFEESSLRQSQNIIINFLLNYELKDEALMNYINFFLINLESDSRRCVLNSLKMIKIIYENKAFSSILSSFHDLIILKCSTLLTTSDEELKLLLNDTFYVIFSIKEINTKKYLDNSINWIEDKNKSVGLKRIALELVSLISTVNSVKAGSYDKLYNPLLNLMRDELSKLEEFQNRISSSDMINNKLDEKRKTKYEINKLFSEKNEKKDKYNLNDLKIKDENVITLNVENVEDWDILYLCLINVEKLIKVSLGWKDKLLNQQLQFVIFNSIKHPHPFVKTVSMRLISNIFEELKEDRFGLLVANIAEEDTSLINYIFLNIKHIFLEPESSDKLLTIAISNCVYLVENLVKYGDRSNYSSLTDIPFEFICRLYIDSKKFLSKKEKASIIFGRIFNLFEQMTSKYETQILKVFLEPMLSLIHRIKTNRLINDDVKEQANVVFDKISKKYLNDDSMKETYKSVSKNINLLRRKRKTEIMQEAITNPQNFVKTRQKNKKKI